MTKTLSGATLAKPPVAEKRPQEKTVHGTRLVDDYAWLKAANWQEVLRDPAALPQDIRALLEAENDYSAQCLAPTADLQKKLAAEMRGRIKEDDAEVPAADGDWLYYDRHRQGGQHPLICRKLKAGGDEIILLDGDEEGKGKAFFEIGEASHAPDHAKLAWSRDAKGSELYSIIVRDLATGKDAEDVVLDTDGTIVWMSDSLGFYYVRVDDNHRTAQVFRHRLGTDPASDVLVLEELDPKWFVHLKRSRSRAFAVVSIADHDSAECHLIDLSDVDAKPRMVEGRKPGIRYDVEHRGDRLYIRTNAGGAEDFKIVSAPLASPGAASWVDEVPHRQGTMVVAQRVFADYHVRLEREGGLPRIVVRAFDGGAEHAIAFDEEAYHLGLEGQLEFQTTTLRFSYSSMTTPKEIYDYDLATHERQLRKRQEIPSGHDPALYITRRLFATAPDGEQVPISILHRKDLVQDGSAPLLLYGYGAYGTPMPAAFGTNRLSLVDRGFVYAIAHIRGGTDKGWHWYTDGKLEKKPNTFSDFVAAGRHLASLGYTRIGRIVAHGGSAGGMLMGASVNLAPELFAGVIADVPFVDVINTMLDADLPLTPPEWLEWGNPILDEKAFQAMLAYSPYDNVGAKHYPPILALGGLTDPRVTYWEPAKWVSRLRATMTGGGPILLKTNMDAGHGGASGRFDHLAEIALEYAFALACVDGTFETSAS
ncbi:S9 family peptidase [Methyloferula stellata]|uniref:S9 family peptidase n=1 Tax=Methyloferula stellata TaxID=876270 RepID=UPI00035C79E0|nr:S9 family peptidase [Methyloferula stellata]